ncbi:MAG: SDR family oxidoreductase [Burkholderiaceae bacterium]|jgi:NAD(P)-dependent dehydrogenase (short-subunit alcohol dehydrogenase family)
MTAPLLFITGASSGIGQAMAVEWARRGGRLALVARRPDEMRAWVAAQGWGADRAEVYAADARDVPAMTAAGRDCIARQGLPDVVIASAGISVGVDMGDASDLDVLRSVIETNNLGMAATFQPFIKPMCARRAGRLVGIASVAGLRGLPGHAAYSMSKAGVISFCESLRVECRGFGVRVVTIAPGYIDTPLTRGNSYSMPFLMPADKFARAALDAIAAGVGFRVIPWQMGMLARVLRILPDWIYDRAVSGRGRKARKSQ